MGEADESVSLFSTLVICNGVAHRVLISWLGVLSVMISYKSVVDLFMLNGSKLKPAQVADLILLDGKWVKVTDHPTSLMKIPYFSRQ